ncbi:MAG: ROK family protein [Thermodesulfobacteriota bacterium]
MPDEIWAIGVDLGGTKIEIARVNSDGHYNKKITRPTIATRGPAAIKREIITCIKDMMKETDSPPAGVGVGLAGQIDPHRGSVHFSPNLGWQNEPFQEELVQALRLPVMVINDVRAATLGEWWHGAGKGCADLVCLFIGTGIGGGVVSGGRILIGDSNSAGELGHITVDWHGPPCRCGNKGCLEALAGGWAIARRAQELIINNRVAGITLLNIAGGKIEEVDAKVVAEGFKKGDPLARQIIEEVKEALIAGTVSLVNAFNPRRLILGGGVMAGLPELRKFIEDGIRERALKAATVSLEVLPAKLGNMAGVIGAGSLVIQTLGKKEQVL